MKTRDFLRDAETVGAPGGDCRVSVLLPCPAHTPAAELAATLDSVLGQSVRDLHLVVIGDGLSPEATSTVREAARRDARVHAILHARTCGLPALRLNEGLSAARGQFIAYQLPGCRWTADALESLLRAAEQEPNSLVIGKIRIEGPGNGSESGCPRHFSDLVERNAIALPGALHSRAMVESCGGFDPHIYQRSFWTWDLWLRFARRVPIRDAQAAIGSARAAALETGPAPDRLCEAAFRAAFGIARDSALSLAALPDYEVDSIEPYGPLSGRLRERLRKFVAVPWRLQQRHEPGASSDFAQTADPPRLGAVVSGVHNCTFEVTIGNMEPALQSDPARPWDLSFWPLQAPVSTQSAIPDQFIFHRTYEPDALQRLRDARAAGAAAMFMADDDMLGLAEQFPDYAFLAPGQPLRECMERQIAEADAAWLYSAEAAPAYRRLNPRVLVRNITVPASWLEREFSRPAAGAPFRIGFAGSAGRGQEMEFLMPVLESLSAEFGAKIELVFWGLGLPGADRLKSPYSFIPYSHSYREYAERLRRTHFDLLLAPLFDQPRARRAKTCVKYLETTAAGCVGIYSDVPPYAAVPSPACAIKVPNTPDAWREAIVGMMRLGAGEREAMWRRARTDILRNHTSEANRGRFLSGLHAAWLHGQFREKRRPDGLPRIAYVFHSITFAGSEMFLCRHAEIAREHGFEPLFCAPARYEDRAGGVREYALNRGIPLAFLPLSATPHPEYPDAATLEREAAGLQEWLARERAALVHSANFIPAAGLAAQRLGLPHVASLYQPYKPDISSFRPSFPQADALDCDSFLYARLWEDTLNVPAYCTRTPVPPAFFDAGASREGSARTAGAPVRLAVIGALHERKGQLKTLEALEQLGADGRPIELSLIGLCGYFPDYEERCKAVIARLHAGKRVTVRFIGFVEDVPGFLKEMDACICASTEESLPQVIPEAMAARVFVISTPVAGVPELVLDGVTGLLACGFEAADLAEAVRRYLALPAETTTQILDRAGSTALQDAHRDGVGERLLWLYAEACRNAGRPAGPAAPASPETDPWKDALRPFGTEEGISYPIAGAKSLRLHVPEAGLAAIRIKLGTYGKPLKGQLRLTLRATDGTAREAEWSAPAEFKDPIWAEFAFPPIERSAGMRMSLSLERRGDCVGSTVSVFQYEPSPATLGQKIRKRFFDSRAVPVARLLYRT